MKSNEFSENHTFYEERARVLKALAHPARLFIVEELNKGERNVQQITELVSLDISTVSKHLSQLKDVGLLTSRRQGNVVFYQLICPCIISFIGCISDVIQQKSDRCSSSVSKGSCSSSNK